MLVLASPIYSVKPSLIASFDSRVFILTVARSTYAFNLEKQIDSYLIVKLGSHVDNIAVSFATTALNTTLFSLQYTNRNISLRLNRGGLLCSLHKIPGG